MVLACQNICMSKAKIYDLYCFMRLTQSHTVCICLYEVELNLTANSHKLKYLLHTEGN